MTEEKWAGLCAAFPKLCFDQAEATDLVLGSPIEEWPVDLRGFLGRHPLREVSHPAMVTAEFILEGFADEAVVVSRKARSIQQCLVGWIRGMAEKEGVVFIRNGRHIVEYERRGTGPPT